jgi:hypothetical protein
MYKLNPITGKMDKVNAIDDFDTVEIPIDWSSGSKNLIKSFAADNDSIVEMRGESVLYKPSIDLTITDDIILIPAIDGLKMLINDIAWIKENISNVSTNAEPSFADLDDNEINSFSLVYNASLNLMYQFNPTYDKDVYDLSDGLKLDRSTAADADDYIVGLIIRGVLF